MNFTNPLRKTFCLQIYQKITKKLTKAQNIDIWDEQRDSWLLETWTRYLHSKHDTQPKYGSQVEPRLKVRPSRRMLGTVWDLHCFWLHYPNHIDTWIEGCTRGCAEDGVSAEWLHRILGWYEQDESLNISNDDGGDNEDNRAIDIHEIHRQRGSVHRGHLQGSGALSARRHCSHIESGQPEARRRGRGIVKTKEVFTPS